MELTPCSWSRVVAALKRCCPDLEVLDRELHVAVAKVPYIFPLSKAGPVPAAIQLKILRRLGITVVEYLSYLPDEVLDQGPRH
jgi:hypothetical protein